MSKPVLFLDVDGVINLFPVSFSSNQGWEVEVEVFQHWLIPGCPVHVPAGTKDRVAKLSEHFEMRWATSWFNDANEQFKDILGLSEDWPVLQWGDLKLESILRQEPDLEFVFLDDDANYEFENLELTLKPTQKFINVNPRTGLTDLHVAEAISAFS